MKCFHQGLEMQLLHHLAFQQLNTMEMLCCPCDRCHVCLSQLLLYRLVLPPLPLIHPPFCHNCFSSLFSLSLTAKIKPAGFFFPSWSGKRQKNGSENWKKGLVPCFSERTRTSEKAHLQMCVQRP